MNPDVKVAVATILSEVYSSVESSERAVLHSSFEAFNTDEQITYDKKSQEVVILRKVKFLLFEKIENLLKKEDLGDIKLKAAKEKAVDAVMHQVFFLTQHEGIRKQFHDVLVKEINALANYQECDTFIKL